MYGTKSITTLRSKGARNIRREKKLHKLFQSQWDRFSILDGKKTHSLSNINSMPLKIMSSTKLERYNNLA
jgi:hypothetical protein